MSWESSEPSFALARAELPRLLRRAGPRAVFVLLIAIVVTSGFLAKRLLRPAKREARMSMRIVEADFDLTKAVRPAKDYVDYIWGVFLAAPRLQLVIEKFHLYPEKFVLDPRLAVEAMREDLDVEVWRNYFLEQNYDVDEARSVRFSIAWKDRDPQLALDVVQALAQVIIAAQTEERRSIFAVGQEDLAQEATEADARLVVLRAAEQKRRAKLATADQDHTVQLVVELRDLEAEEANQDKRLETLRDERTRFELEAAWERERSGLRFELVDPGFVVPLESGPRKLAATGLLIFFATAFLAALVFGAFEVKIRFATDVRRLGIPLLGELPPFPGDDVGSLADRLAAEDRLRWEKR